MKTKHTPGPWIIKTALNGDKGIIAPGIGILAECFVAIRNRDEVSPEAAANAKLIAASPDMLIALYEAENALADYILTIEKSGNASLNYGHATLRKVRAAIAKATGGDAK